LTHYLRLVNPRYWSGYGLATIDLTVTKRLAHWVNSACSFHRVSVYALSCSFIAGNAFTRCRRETVTQDRINFLPYTFLRHAVQLRQPITWQQRCKVKVSSSQFIDVDSVPSHSSTKVGIDHHKSTYRLSIIHQCVCVCVFFDWAMFC
jgi:hypothetical protein